MVLDPVLDKANVYAASPACRHNQDSGRYQNNYFIELFYSTFKLRVFLDFVNNDTQKA